MWLRIIKHLLPKSLVWNITFDTYIRKLFEGLSNSLGPLFREIFDKLFIDFDPYQTRQLDKFEEQFDLRDYGLTESQQRMRLDNAWKMRGGQDPSYIQQVLQDNGFDVYVHEWWDPLLIPDVNVKDCGVPRNPFLYLRNATGLFSGVDAGEPLAEAGEPFAEAGNTFDPVGYPLVNNILVTEAQLLVGAGEPLMEAGEVTAESGYFENFVEYNKEYEIPNETDCWSYFIYICAETFGDAADVPTLRKKEFETLLLKICPVHLWIGVIVNYT